MSSTRRRLPGVFLAFFIALLMILPVSAAFSPARAQQPYADKVVIIVVDRVGMDLFPSPETPFCSRLAREWAVGMMISKSEQSVNGREPDNGAEYVTLATGTKSRSSASRYAGLFFNTDETPPGYASGSNAGELYLSFNGRPPGGASVVSLGKTQVRKQNERIGLDGDIFALGKMLTRAGKKAAVVGNSDTLTRSSRLAANIVSDPEGTIALGDLSVKTQSEDGLFPGGYTFDNQRLLEESETLLGEADLLVVDTGDTGRLDRLASRMSDEVLNRYRTDALKRIDRFVEELASTIDLEKSTLIVLSPGTTVEARKNDNYLAPFIAAGNGFSTGVVTSKSTRRSGVIMNVDLFPTIAGLYDAPISSSTTGARISCEAFDGDTLEYLRELDRQHGQTRKARAPVTVMFFVLTGIVLIMTVLSTPGVNARTGFPRNREASARACSFAAVVLLAMPISLVIVSVFSYDGYLFPLLFCLLFPGAVGAAALLLHRRFRSLNPVMTVCMLTVVLLTIGVAVGGRALMFPLLGGSELDGIRVYGFGNAISGLFIATGIWGIASAAGGRLLEKGPVRVLSFLFLGALSVVTGFGLLGADVGGFVAVFATALVLYMESSGRRFSPVSIAVIVAMTAFATAALIILDSIFIHTHAGQVVESSGNSLLTMLVRKLGIQMGMIGKVAFPATLLIVAVLALALWIKRPDGFWSSQGDRTKLLAVTLFSALVGSLIALAFNDTGISILGTMCAVTALSAAWYVSDPSFSG